MIGLLEGLGVLEAAVLLTGDYLGMLLADEGADVVKVETPGTGDWIRDHMGAVAPRYSPYHLFVNRNKRSVALNLKTRWVTCADTADRPRAGTREPPAPARSFILLSIALLS